MIAWFACHMRAIACTTNLFHHHLTNALINLKRGREGGGREGRERGEGEKVNTHEWRHDNEEIQLRRKRKSNKQSAINNIHRLR